METYKLIIKNSIKTNINFFSPDYKEDKTIKFYIKMSFCLFEKDLNNQNKYKILSQTLNGFLLNDNEKKEEFIDYFYKIQKTYNTITRFAYNYKYKKTKIVVNTDMGLNKLIENGKNVISIIDNNSKYLFHVNDLINIINTSLTNSHLFFSEPKSVKNPYNNLPFNKSTLYNIYFYIRYKTDYYPELFFKFFECNFNLTNFKFLNENLLREYTIENYVYKSPVNVIEKDIKQMILAFNLHCERVHVKNRILIDEDFPINKLATIMKPYLFLYCKSLYSFHPQIKKQYSNLFKLRMLRFNKFNPQFGRKRYKILYKTTNYFKKKICGKETVFDDKCVNFYENENEKDFFLSDHLKYDEDENNFILNNSLFLNHSQEEHYYYGIYHVEEDDDGDEDEDDDEDEDEDDDEDEDEDDDEEDEDDDDEETVIDNNINEEDEEEEREEDESVS